MEKKLEILITKNYDQSYLLEGNRAINERHVRDLMMSMSEEEAISPIQVNEKYAIIDGQHRFRALQELKKPIYYYVVKGANIRTVQRLNSYTANWKTEDYMNSYAEAGYKDYIQYRGFKEMYKFGNSINILLLTGSIDRATEEKKFKNGEFKIKNIQKAVDDIMKLEGLSKYISWYKERSWCYAVLRALKVKGFDYEKFLHKYSYQTKALVKCANAEQYLQLIQDIYNYKMPTDQKLTLKKS